MFVQVKGTERANGTAANSVRRKSWRHPLKLKSREEEECTKGGGGARWAGDKENHGVLRN